MYLIELAVQGVRGCSPAARVPLKPGYLALKPPAGAEPFPLCGLVASLLFSDGRGSDAAYLAKGLSSGKAGLAFQGNDQLTYRVVRELGGAGVLQRLEAASQKPVTVSQDAAEIAQFLRAQVGVPPKRALEQLFCFTASQLPSKKPRPKPAAQKPAAAQLPQAQQLSGDLPTLQSKLLELEKEHRFSKEVDELQFRLDGVSSQLFELESKLKGAEGLKAAIRGAESEAAAAPTPESLNLAKDILALCQRYPTLVQKRDEALARLAEEREQAEAASVPRHVQPLYQDRRFWGGLAVGVVSLALGSQLSGYARYLALLDIPALGFAALLALQYVEELKMASRVSRRGEFLATREQKIRDDFEAEAGQVKAAISATRVESPQELVELFSKRPLLQQKLEQLRQELSALEQDPEYARAAASYQQLKAEQEALNARLLEKGAYVRDVREVEREMARTREAIDKLQGKAPPAPAPLEQPAGEAFDDPAPALLSLAADLLQLDAASLGAGLGERCAQYLAALTDRRCLGVELDQAGRSSVMVSGKKTPAGALPPTDLDLMFLALRLTLAEKLSPRLKVPLLLEDALGFVEPPKQSMVGKMLRQLGALTQVLHVSPGSGAADSAELAVNV